MGQKYNLLTKQNKNISVFIDFRQEYHFYPNFILYLVCLELKRYHVSKFTV